MKAALLALDVKCPVCGTRPNLRVLPILAEMVDEARPDQVLGTWGCQQCPEKILITAGMIQRATQKEGRTA